MTCPKCSSIWLRPSEATWSAEGQSQWARRFECGGCGAVLVLRVTQIGVTMTDHEKSVAYHNPAPPAMVENGVAK